jgi:hypothetical protein
MLYVCKFNVANRNIKLNKSEGSQWKKNILVYDKMGKQIFKYTNLFDVQKLLW